MIIKELGKFFASALVLEMGDRQLSS